jgi:hypothetical protein
VRYWIRDEDDTPQGFPLKVLIQLIIRQLGSSVFQLWILRSQGYGLRIKEWDELLDKQERLLVDHELLQEISSGTEEWFYDLDAEIIADDLLVRFGLHDSTALYIDAPQEFCELIIKSFKLVKKAGSTGAS